MNKKNGQKDIFKKQFLLFNARNKTKKYFLKKDKSNLRKTYC